MTVLETISKIQQTDEGTARLLLELALYDATCAEVDRVRPQLDEDVSKALSHNAARGLVYLARQPVSKASIEIADQLVELVKRDTDWNEGQHPRNEAGEFAPKDRGVRRHVLNALGWATGRQSQQANAKTHDVMNAWAGPDADKYSRLRSLGGSLAATNDPHMKPAGTVLGLIGDIGPEAQRHLEPGIRRTAYRYRGTERRPDKLAQEKIAALTESLQGPGQDQARLRLTSDFGAAQLIPDIPDKDTAAISLAAGKMPPSTGMMFDHRGRLVSEAMGFNGDHYLPFDLRNLKRLKGGSYVRTRTTGGPTDEDIYTGLMTGARHLTVVSNSGVFTLEFDPDLRGGRRYSDKARQMVDRYARLTAAIGSGELYKTPLPPDRVRAIRADALRAAGGNAEAAQGIFTSRLREAQEAASFEALDDDELRSQAESEVKAGGNGTGTFASQVKDRFNTLRAERDSKIARKYRLDGEGYKAALKALKTEFPYFIRSATYTPLQEYGETRKLKGFEPGTPRRPRGGKDIGHVPRGGLTPPGAGVHDKDGNKQILGEPRRGSDHTPQAWGSGGGGGSASAPDAPAGGGDGDRARSTAEAATSAGAAGNLDEAVARALKAQTSPLFREMAKSVVIRHQVAAAAWPDPPLVDGKLEDESTAHSYPGQMFVKWYFMKHDNDLAKVAEALPNDSAKNIELFTEGAKELKSEALRSDFDGPKTSEADFDAAIKRLDAIRQLKQPFAPGQADLLKSPPLGAKDPQAVPEIVDKLKPEDLTRWMQTEDGQGAVKWDRKWGEKMDDAGIGEAIRFQAERIENLLALANGEDVPGLDKDFDMAEARDVKDGGVNSQAVKDLKDMQRGWALRRMRHIVGSLSGSGAAVPFPRPAEGPEAGTPGPVSMRFTGSRIVRHSPDSPVAKALRERLSRR